METAVVGGIISKVTEYFVDPILKPLRNQVRYLFCFKSIVDGLNEQERQLISTKRHMQQAVESAKNNAEIIEEDAEEWLNGVSKILVDVQTLKEEMEADKTCLNCVGRYRLGRKATKEIKDMLNLQERGKFDKVSYPAPLPGIEFSASEDFELFQSSKLAFDQIIEALRNDETYLVGLYAMGGAGKTTLAKAVGVKIREEGTFNVVVTIPISQTPNFKDIQDNLASQLNMKKLEESGEEERAKRLYLRFKNTKEKILVILDDVWGKFDLKSKIGIVFDKAEEKNYKILVTTRKEDVCIAMGCQKRIPLNLLTEGEGLALLKKNGGIANDSTLNDLVVEIARECKGLPLAIVTIGSALKEKGIDEWKLVSQKLKKSKLGEIGSVIDVYDDVYAILKFSYDNLKGDETKLCFLLCSLFPEDYKIHLEELVVYGIGRSLFSNTNSIEEARSQLRVTLNRLKASSLLLDAGEDCVKMHDVVRDVALWIASEGQNVFMSKAGMTLSDWSKEKGWEQYTAICSVDNKIEVLPASLVCPKLEILLLPNTYHFSENKLKVSDKCFTEMKALKVLCLSYADLSLKSLQFLTNLKTLVLKNCNLRDVTFLGKLKRLEILGLENSSFESEELPEELGELKKLRYLDLRGCFNYQLGNIIHSNLIKKFSQLEELYIFSEDVWEVEGTNVERSKTSLSVLGSLPCLEVVFLVIKPECLPKDFVFPKFLRHLIYVNHDGDTYYDKSYTRALNISNVDVTSLTAFKALYETLEYLCLEEKIGCQNILPSIDQRGLNRLESLELRYCNELECVLDMTLQEVPAKALSKLVKLQLKNFARIEVYMERAHLSFKCNKP